MDPKKSKRRMTDQEITDYYVNQMLEKEKQFNKWKYIQKPSPSRLTVSPPSGKKYIYSDRSIEKIVFGDYLLLRYLMKNTKEACFIYPDLPLSIDAIQLFYDMKENNIPFRSTILQDWKKAYPLVKDIPELRKKYERTFPIVSKNLSAIQNILKFNENGPRLTRDVRVYDKLIYILLEELMNQQRIELDTTSNEKFTIPYEYRLQNCLESGKRYIVFFIRLKIKEDSLHANMMILDTKKKTAERFEPQGMEHDFYDSEFVDKKIATYFQKIGYQYIGPSEMCPYGVQTIVESYTMDKYEFSGFCKTWSFLYAFIRLKIDELDRNTITENMNLLVRELAKEYFDTQYNRRISVKDEKDYDFVIEFLYDYIPNILQEGKEDIEMINQTLGTHIILEGRTLHTRD
jgi:hypothetical protein